MAGGLKRPAGVAIFLGLLLAMAAGFPILRRLREAPSSAGNHPVVVTTLPLFANLVERIGGEEVRVTSILPGGVCGHDYEPTPGQLERLAGAVLFVKAGAGLDPWADGVLAGLAGRKPLLVDAASGVSAAGKDRIHYWWDPEEAAGAAENILQALCGIKPQRADLFRRNYRSFRDELTQTAAELRADTARLGERRLVSYSAAFSPLFSYFGFINLATVEEVHEEEVSARRLVEVAGIIRRQKVGVIVGETTNPRPAEILARETGARLVLLWPTTDDTGDYLHTLRRNVALLCEGFR